MARLMLQCVLGSISFFNVPIVLNLLVPSCFCVAI